MIPKVIDRTEGALVVTALDFDGCIQRKDADIKTKKKYLASQKDLLKFLEENHTDIMLSGSNRTCPSIDDTNSGCFWNSPGVSFNVFPWLATKTRRFDDFLLNDLWAHHDNGHPFESGDTIRLIQSLFDKTRWDNTIIFYTRNYMLDYDKDKVHLERPDYLDAIWMKDKINLVYAHIHRLANAYPNKTITYQLLDDKADYLYALSYFYNKLPELVPKNVQIQLIQHHYKSPKFNYIQNQSTYKNISRFDPIFFNEPPDKTADKENHFYPHNILSTDERKECTIHGTGMIDKHFDKTVKLMAKLEYNPKVRKETLEHNWFFRSIDVEHFKKTQQALAKNALITAWKGKEYETTFPARFFQDADKAGHAVESDERLKNPATAATRS